MKILHYVAFVLVIIGGLNWGFTALGWNVVYMILGSWPVVEQIVYILVGLSAIYLAVMHASECKVCSADGKPMGMGM